jgi:predicted  nucleic acid-binding Zn-ribbon protein
MGEHEDKRVVDLRNEPAQLVVIPESMICKCKRCGHVWVKRVATRTARCPKCTHKRWDIAVGEQTMGRQSTAAKGLTPEMLSELSKAATVARRVKAGERPGEE